MKTIVILGASYAGISTAHRLLQQSAKTRNVKIVLISPSTHMYWNIAATRAIIPAQIPDEKIFLPIAPGFKQYKADQFEIFVGTAESLDIEAKRVSVSSKSGTTIVEYDYLILATGSRPKAGGPWKVRESFEATRDALHEYQDKVKRAKSITIAGSGSTGVETSGELGFEYGSSKKITLIASGSKILQGTPDSVSKTATKLLKSLHIAIMPNTTVLSNTKLDDGRTELTLSSGQKITTDLYLPAMGLTPNSAYIPSKFLNEKGFVIVDEFLQVKGTKNVWAVGDVSAIQRPQFVNTDKQSIHLVKNIGLMLNGRDMVPYKTGGGDMLAVPIGRKTGTGHMGSMRFPGFLINIIKGKTLFTENLPKVVNGA